VVSLGDVLSFAFIVALPLVLVAGGLASLFGVGALFDVLDHLDDLRPRMEGIFRKPLAAAKTPGKDHYYQPYWTAK
jgi:hypothetical protein